MSDKLALYYMLVAIANEYRPERRAELEPFKYADIEVEREA